MKAVAWVETNVNGEVDDKAKANVIVGFAGYNGNPLLKNFDPRISQDATKDATPMWETPQTKALHTVGNGGLNPQTKDVPAFMNQVKEALRTEGLTAEQLQIAAHSLGSSNALAAAVDAKNKGLPVASVLLVEPIAASSAFDHLSRQHGGAAMDAVEAITTSVRNIHKGNPTRAAQLVTWNPRDMTEADIATLKENLQKSGFKDVTDQQIGEALATHIEKYANNPDPYKKDIRQAKDEPNNLQQAVDKWIVSQQDAARRANTSLFSVKGSDEQIHPRNETVGKTIFLQTPESLSDIAGTMASRFDPAHSLANIANQPWQVIGGAEELERLTKMHQRAQDFSDTGEGASPAFGPNLPGTRPKPLEAPKKEQKALVSLAGGDDMLTYKEFEQLCKGENSKAKLAELLEEMDANGDHFVTKKEAAEALEKIKLKGVHGSDLRKAEAIGRAFYAEGIVFENAKKAGVDTGGHGLNVIDIEKTLASGAGRE